MEKVCQLRVEPHFRIRARLSLNRYAVMIPLLDRTRGLGPKQWWWRGGKRSKPKNLLAQVRNRMYPRMFNERLMHKAEKPDFLPRTPRAARQHRST